MQKKCFPFDIKKSSHQLSKHWLHRKAGMLLQSAGEHKARVFSELCQKEPRALASTPGKRWKHRARVRMPSATVCTDCYGVRGLDGNNRIFFTNSLWDSLSFSQGGSRLRSNTVFWEVPLHQQRADFWTMLSTGHLCSPVLQELLNKRQRARLCLGDQPSLYLSQILRVVTFSTRIMKQEGGTREHWNDYFQCTCVSIRTICDSLRWSFNIQKCNTELMWSIPRLHRGNVAGCSHSVFDLPKGNRRVISTLFLHFPIP